jgi:Rhodanese-related sulfurtransferase
MTMRTILFASLAALVGLSACQNNSSSSSATGVAASIQDSIVIRVWPAEVDSLRKIDPNMPMIDVRTELEFQTSHIYRAINCDHNAPDFAQRIVKLGTNTPVIVYDMSGVQSLVAAEKMRSLGFKRVYELAGGISKWVADGRTLVSGESKMDASTILR